MGSTCLNDFQPPTGFVPVIKQREYPLCEVKPSEVVRLVIELRSHPKLPIKACYNLFHDAAVAQLDRVLGYEPRGRGFDSCQPHQNFRSRTTA